MHTPQLSGKDIRLVGIVRYDSAQGIEEDIALEDELIVGRADGAITLLQPDKLLDLLSANFRPPVEKARYVGKVNLSERELQTALADTARRIGARFALTGAASATKYAVMAREPVVTAYCDCPPEELLAALTHLDKDAADADTP